MWLKELSHGMYNKNKRQRENKGHQSRKREIRVCQKFAVAEQRPDPLGVGADQLSKAQVEDMTMKSVWKRAQEIDTCVFYNAILEKG